MLAITFPVEGVVSACFQLLIGQSFTQVLDSILLLNCALSLIRISAGLIFPLVRNVTVMSRATAKGTTCALIVITTKKSG